MIDALVYAVCGIYRKEIITTDRSYRLDMVSMIMSNQDVMNIGKLQSIVLDIFL
jgi:hypothetical protein